MLEQPVDGVVGVRTFVEVGRTLARVVRADVDELALRVPSAAHVLVDEDVALFLEEGRRAKSRAVVIDAVGPTLYGVRLSSIGYVFVASFGMYTR